MPPAPLVVREQVLTSQKKNKKGKSVGRPVLTGFALVYSEPMDPASAGLAANYQVDTTTTKHAKKKASTVLKPVAFTSVFNSATNTVTLTIKGKPNFKTGGQIAIIAASPGGVASAAGEPLVATDTEFSILPNAKGIEGPS